MSMFDIICSVPRSSFVHFFLHYSGAARRGRRRKRCRNCAKLLKDDDDEEFCDEACQDMYIERNKKDDFVSKFY